MEINFLAVLVAAVSALFVGFIWYNPKVFGTAWMQAADMTEDKIKSASMAKIFILAFIFAILLSMSIMPMVIHQMGAYSLAQGELGVLPSYDAFMADYSNEFRTFKHGAFHGVLAGVFVALPILGTNALFERKSAKYIFINSGYWIVTLGVMGAIICGWK
jgi:hypothetical protein